MTKKHFIELADMIKDHNNGNLLPLFSDVQIGLIADFCASQNSRFNRERWLSYIAGECGPNGEKVRK